MKSFHQYINEYRKQIEKGYVKTVYKGLMEYITGLKLYLKNKYPDYFVSGSVNYGYMDYTYFYFFPASIKSRNLKIVLLFIHDTFKFELWLAGYNRNIQKKYLELFTENKWTGYPVAPGLKGYDYILRYTVADKPDFSDPDKLTKQIEKKTLNFIKDIEDFLSEH